jgi:hypothetical protein
MAFPPTTYTRSSSPPFILHAHLILELIRLFVTKNQADAANVDSGDEFLMSLLSPNTVEILQ